MFTYVAFFILLVASFIRGESTTTVFIFSAMVIYRELFNIRKALEEKKND